MRGSGIMNRGGGGSGMSLALPPFTGVVKKLLIINTAVFMLTLLAQNFAPFLLRVLRFGWLVPSDVLHGALWELVTYSFFHVGLFHLLFNMLALWMFGSQFEMDWGSPAISGVLLLLRCWSRDFDHSGRLCRPGAQRGAVRLAFSRISRTWSTRPRWSLRRHLRPAHRLRDTVRRPPDLHVPFAVRDQSQVHGWHMDIHCPGGSFAGCGRSGQLRASWRRLLWLALSPVHVAERAADRTASQGFGGFFRHPQQLLPLEAPPGREEIRSLHAQAGPLAVLRRARQF